MQRHHSSAGGPFVTSRAVTGRAAARWGVALRGGGVLVAAVLVVAGLVAGRASAAGHPLTEAQLKRATPIVEVVNSQVDAVVNVSATHIVEQPSGFFMDVPREVKSNSVGSGAVIHPSGYVLTNAHVVARASELSVIFRDGRELPATTVAVLTEDDIAIIKVELPAGQRLPAVTLGRSDDIMVGETVIAIGNPVGLQHSVTMGIVSAVGRSFGQHQEFKDILQTDAAINPGNSGGPLFNILGEQIGVNTAIRTDAQNVGFAIPIDRVKALLPRLLAVEARGRVKLGVNLGAEVSEPARGVLVGAVEKDSPADRAGLSAGMLIVSVAGRDAGTLIDALVALLEQPVGKGFPVQVRTPEGLVDELKMTIEALPKPDGKRLAEQKFGVTLQELDAGSARKLGLRPGAGLLVVDVGKKGPGAKAGLQAGDLVLTVGEYGVRKLEDLGVLLENVPSGARVDMRVVRFTARGAFQADAVLSSL